MRTNGTEEWHEASAVAWKWILAAGQAQQHQKPIYTNPGRSTITCSRFWAAGSYLVARWFIIPAKPTVLYKNNKHALLLNVYDGRDNQHLIGSFSSSSPPPPDAIDLAFHDGRLLSILFSFIKTITAKDKSEHFFWSSPTHFQKMLLKLSQPFTVSWVLQTGNMGQSKETSGFSAFWRKSVLHISLKFVRIYYGETEVKEYPSQIECAEWVAALWEIHTRLNDSSGKLPPTAS